MADQFVGGRLLASAGNLAERRDWNRRELRRVISTAEAKLAGMEELGIDDPSEENALRQIIADCKRGLRG